MGVVCGGEGVVSGRPFPLTDNEELIVAVDILYQFQ